MSEIVVDGNLLIFACPHCGLFVQVQKNETNCKIFRHGVYKLTGQQIPPHMPRDICEQIVNVIYGCGKPFQIVGNTVEKCDYI